MTRRCATIGCYWPSAVALTYFYRGERITDDVCQACADHYGRRAGIMVLSTARASERT